MKETFFGTGGDWLKVKEWWFLQRVETRDEESLTENKWNLEGKLVFLRLFLVAERRAEETMLAVASGDFRVRKQI